jgi:hypothetical protein
MALTFLEWWGDVRRNTQGNLTFGGTFKSQFLSCCMIGKGIILCRSNEDGGISAPPVALDSAPADDSPGSPLSTAGDNYVRTPLDLPSDARNRRRPQPLNQQLPATARWAASLPVEIQPLTLLQDIPRIANAIARLWRDDIAVRQYLDDLLIDRRGGRLGFAPQIHHELVQLRAYCERR